MIALETRAWRRHWLLAGLLPLLVLLAPAWVQASADAGPVAEVADAEDQLAARVLELTNAERQRNGLAPLVPSEPLTLAAQSYVQHLATGACFGHSCGPVASFVSRAEQAGYTDWTSLGENVAEGHETPETVVAAWMASSDHRANILSPDFEEFGVGLARGDDGLEVYWAQTFGARQ